MTHANTHIVTHEMTHEMTHGDRGHQTIERSLCVCAAHPYYILCADTSVGDEGAGRLHADNNPIVGVDQHNNV